MNKTKTIVISLLLTVALFITLVIAERKLTNYSPSVDIVFCTKDIQAGQPLDKSCFTRKSISVSSLKKEHIVDLETLNGMYAKENIYANEYLLKQRIAKAEEINNLLLQSNEREYSLTLSSIDKAVAGTLRQDDYIDIIYTNGVSATNPSKKSETILKNIKIINAFDNNGIHINKNDKSLPSTTFILAVTEEQALKIESGFANGTIKFMKVPKSYIDSQKTLQ